jgi:hypothetical protein
MTSLNHNVGLNVDQEAGYRDRDGEPVGLERWAALWDDFGYRRVAETQVEGTNVVVRTVWEGIVSPVTPMFATGVSMDGGKSWQTPADGEDAQTKDEALEQHERVLQRVKNTLRA